MPTLPISTALCSFGMSGKVFHAPFISINPGFILYGVWERSGNKAEEKYPSIKTFRSLAELLSDDNIELVVVNTPSVTHFEYAMKCLEAGKHIIVEKPFTATVREAEILIDLAAKKNLKLSVYHNRRYDSDYRTVKKILEEGWIGEVIDAEIRYDRYSPQLSYKAHKETPTPAVGSLYDLGSHIIDQAIQLFGMPESVFADITINRPGSQVDDYFDLKLFYPHHRVSLRSSYFVREPLPGYVFNGRLGTFIKTKTDVQEVALLEGRIPDGEHWGVESKENDGFLHTEREGRVIKKHIQPLKGNYGDYYEAMFRAIRNNESVPVTGEEGKSVIQVIEAAIKSRQEGRVVHLGQ